MSDREEETAASAAPQFGMPVTRIGSQFLIDALAWLFAIPFAGLLRYDFEVSKVSWLPLVVLAFIMALSQWAVGYGLKLYRGRFAFGSFEEVRAVTVVTTILTTVSALTLFVIGPIVKIPRGVMLIAFPIAMVAMLATRYVKRLIIERGKRPDEAAPTLIYGAGYLGESLVRQMTTDPHSPYLPVGFLDDDLSRAALTIRHVPVLGTFEDLERAAILTGAETLVVAINRAGTEDLKRVDDAARALGLEVLIMPPLTEMLKGPGGMPALRNIQIEDLISRQVIDTNVSEIVGYLTGKRVLVTGAGGSIGSELARQITKFGPSELILLDHDETGLQETQISIDGDGLLLTKSVVLADIRDGARLREIFTERGPEVVFHAAALKHLPLLEHYPGEAWQTNVVGTLNVLLAADAGGAETFVNISTDKAADPSSVLGHSKRVAEKLTAWMASQQTNDSRYVSVRFGNVIGSRGSMLPTFTSLIERGGPLTVTHPDVTRYFMTIPEACQLVMQAGGIGRAGEVLILDMGEPVRILDIAQKMIELSGKNIEIVFTGLREGEKLHEDLTGKGEGDERPFHPLITHAHIDVLSPDNLNREIWESRLHKGHHGPKEGDQ